VRGTGCPTVGKHSFSRKGASWCTHVSSTYMSIGAPQSEDHKWSRVDPILKGPVALNRWSVALREYDPRETDCLRGASEVLAGWPEPDRRSSPAHAAVASPRDSRTSAQALRRLMFHERGRRGRL